MAKLNADRNHGGARKGAGAKATVKGGRMLAVRLSPEHTAKLDVARGVTPIKDFVRAWLEAL